MKLEELIKLNELHSKDVEVFLTMPLEDFVKELEDIDLELLKRGYATLIKDFLLVLRNRRIDYIFASKLADAFHNLPYYIANKMRGFSAHYFWGCSDDESFYIREMFIHALWSIVPRSRDECQRN